LTRVESVLACVRPLFLLPVPRAAPDTSLWEHAQRVMHLAELLADLPELADERPEPAATALAGLFHDAGWAIQAAERDTPPVMIMNRPTSDIQRELAATVMQQQLDGALPREVLELAAEALRQCGNRSTRMPEAQVVADAVGLEEIGLTYLLRQHRQQHAEGRSLRSLLDHWKRQREYHFWEARIQNCLRFGAARELARQRLAAVDAFLAALQEQIDAADVARRVGAGTAESAPGGPERT
jgi:5'-deoxynucleotidase YfbR-like HD superfamily hydrolase